MRLDGNVAAVIAMWAVQAGIAAMVGIGVTGTLRWAKSVNKRLTRIESRLRISSHRK